MTTILSLMRPVFAACTIALVLSACGGGDGASTESPSTNPTPTSPLPTDPQPPTGPVAELPAGRTVAAGLRHSLFVKADGTVWAVGQNTEGQLGDGTFADRTTAVQVSSLSNVTAVAAGDRFSLALRGDGTVWAWGLNDEAQLGDGSHTVMQTPYTIAGEPVYNVGVTHIDEMVAWVDESTLLLPEVTAEELAAADAAGDAVTRIAHEVLAEAYAILSAATDQDGRPLRIVRVPEPGPIVVEIGPNDAAWQMVADMDQHPVHRLRGAERFANGERVKYLLPASYMNFLVTDGLVVKRQDVISRRAEP